MSTQNSSSSPSRSSSEAIEKDKTELDLDLNYPPPQVFEEPKIQGKDKISDDSKDNNNCLIQGFDCQETEVRFVNQCIDFLGEGSNQMNNRRRRYTIEEKGKRIKVDDYDYGYDYNHNHNHDHDHDHDHDDWLKLRLGVAPFDTEPVAKRFGEASTSSFNYAHERK